MHIREHVNPKELVARLETDWRSRLQPQALHAEIRATLQRIKEELARDSDDARLVLHVYHHWLQGQAGTEELERANRALEHIVADLGLFILAAMPLGFITLPAVFALARHFGVDLATHPPEGGDTHGAGDGHDR